MTAHGATFGDTAPARGCAAMVDGVAATFQVRTVIVDCTGTGTCTLTFDDGTSFTFHMQANTLYTFNGNITTFHAATGACTATAFY